MDSVPIKTGDCRLAAYGPNSIRESWLGQPPPLILRRNKRTNMGCFIDFQKSNEQVTQ